MSRQHKFRAFDPANKQMRYGQLMYYGYVDLLNPGYEGMIFLQCIGGRKDSIGLDIYEGDVVHCYGGETNGVNWERETMVLIEDIREIPSEVRDAPHVEVMGNIYQSPNLINLVKSTNSI